MLRPYQADGKAQIREHYRQGRRKVLLHLATGGGKTVVFSDIMKDAVASGKRPIMVVRGRHLVSQASDRLRREGVYHGVMMAGHWNYQPIAPVQICSIDTLIARGLTPPADLIVIDEAHMAVSPGYTKFLEQYPNAYILAVTATPFVKTSLRHIADVVVKPITVLELMEQGFLVRPRYYAPSTPDTSGVKVSRMTGDFDQTELAELMSKGHLVGDIVAHWKRLAPGRRTICFATSVEHSKNIVEQFRMSGIMAEHCEAETKDAERANILKRLETGETKVVSNVGILCTGVDLPYVDALIQARPTKSYNLFIQQAGRGTRPFPGKDDFILLDHAGNVLRHGLITDERECDLDGTKPKESDSIKVCSNCFAVFRGFSCECGYVSTEEERPREVLRVDGELQELTTLPVQAQILRDIQLFKETQKKRGYKKGWVYFQLSKKWGEEVAQQYMPRRPPLWLTTTSNTQDL